MKCALAEERYTDVPTLAMQMDSFALKLDTPASAPAPAPTPAPTAPGKGDDTVLWEMMVVPAANNTGREQPTFFRFMQVNKTTATAGNGASKPATLHFNTFSYVNE